jgi:translation initiation factor eIF-2B subunit epsilon
MGFQLGPGGVGHVWPICEGGHEEEWRHSVAPIPADKLAEATQSLEDDLEFLNLDGNALSTSGELKPGRNGTDSEDDDAEDSRDDSIYYEKEVKITQHLDDDKNFTYSSHKTLNIPLCFAG